MHLTLAKAGLNAPKIIQRNHNFAIMLEKIGNKTDAHEGYISVTGGRIWYRMLGAEKKGIPLLTLHGGPAAAHDYLEPLEKLSYLKVVRNFLAHALK